MADGVLHAQLRIYRANSYYKSLLKTAITSKCGWRRRIARRELRKLKMAARETWELREAKEKLEKHVEQLMRRFKIILNYLQETKDEEIATLKDALYDMQNQLEEASVIKEQEAARIAIEETPSVIVETPVLIQYTEKVDSLTAEVESLKAMQLSERHEAEEVRKACTDAEVRIAELAEKMENSERKVDRLQDSVRRLEEKLSTSESENQVLRQQGQAHISLKDKQQENQDLLIKCIVKNVGFSGEKPVAACVIYKCLLHWGTFEVESTSLFDRIIQTIDSAIKKVKAPAFRFKQQLTACLEKIYGMIRDCIKKEMSPLLRCFDKTSIRAWGCSEGNSLAVWQAIMKRLRSYLETMKANHVHPFLVRKILTQIFAYINVQLFNSLLLRRECCSFSNGEDVKAALAELERWCCNATNLYAGSAWDELKHIRQAVGFLVFRESSK